MRQFVGSSVAVLLAVAAPAVANAQACFGVPTGTRSAIVGTVAFPDEATQFGAVGFTTLASNVYGSAFVNVTSFDDDIIEIDNQTTVGANVGYEIPSLAATASVCPTVGASYATVESLNLLSVPFGVGIGTTLPLGTGTTTVTPYVQPQFVWTRFSIDDVDGSDTDTSFGTNAGATVGFGQFLVGASVGKVFEDGNDAVFGLLAGYSF